MKHKLLKLIPLWLLTALPSALHAVDVNFTYTQHGFTINYTILNNQAQTAKTKESRWTGTSAIPGNSVTGNLTLPSTVSYSKTSYTLTEIGTGSFYNNSGLKSVSIPNSVTSISAAAFEGCSGLTSVWLPDLLTSIQPGTFSGCSSLPSLNLPNSVTTIEYNAFYDCSSLTSVRLPNSLTTIGDNAFHNCSSLTSVTLPNSLTTIGKSAFSDCSGLTSVTLPNSLTVIGNEAFRGCSDLTSVTLPNSLTAIGNEAFHDCSDLTLVIYDAEEPISATSYTFDDSTYENAVLYVNSKAIEKCKAISPWKNFSKVYALGEFSYTYEGQTITYSILDEDAKTVSTANNLKVSGSLILPETVYYNNTAYKLTTIAGGSFFGCSGMKSLTLPNSLTTIGDWAFSGCSGLTNMTIPNSLTTIGDNAFKGCSGLTNMTIPNSLTTIGDNAFKGCSGLTSLTLPNSLTTIGRDAFQGCIGLISDDRNVTQTTISGEVKKVDSKSNFEPAAKLGDNMVNGKYRFTDLKLNTRYTIEYGFKYKENFCKITSEAVTTKSVDLNFSISNKTSTSIGLLPMVDNGDAKISEEYWDNISGYPSGQVEIAGLNPGSSYTFKYVVKGESGWKAEQSVNVTTKDLELKTQPGQAMNMTTALLSAQTNISELEENVGFEWRRYDAPATLPSQKVMCAVVDGMLMGALSNLNPDVYYNYRPFYTSNSGNTYYGDWTTIFTGDANVYFDPTVRTYTTTNVGETGATIRGYALRGSDDIKRQGFQYWSEATSRAANDVAEVEVSGTRLTYPLNGLKPGTTYSYRVFVETAAGTTYGDTVSFTTKGEESGIDEVETETQSATVVGYWNVQGVRSDKPYRGLNIVRYSDGTVRKEMR